jgi:hypothetical protein
MTMIAPVALFVYKRKEHTRRVVEALENNVLARETDLFIFSDGAKSQRDRGDVEAVRKYVNGIKGFRSVSVIESKTNKGLATSITEGVAWVLERYPNIIVLEDDLVTSPYFLSYMNEGLTMYEHDDEVVSIHGYVYPVRGHTPQSFFIRGADCWGWATWRRAWKLFEHDGRKLLQELKEKNLTSTFDFENAYPFTKMLEDQIEGLNDSWAIRWNASAFLKNKLTLYPGVSLVRNIGFGPAGTHTTTAQSAYDVVLRSEPIVLERIEVAENVAMRSALSRFFRRSKTSLLQRVITKLARLIKS